MSRTLTSQNNILDVTCVPKSDDMIIDRYFTPLYSDTNHCIGIVIHLCVYRWKLDKINPEHVQFGVANILLVLESSGVK